MSDAHMTDKYRQFFLRRRMFSGDVLYHTGRADVSRELVSAATPPPGDLDRVSRERSATPPPGGPDRAHRESPATPPPEPATRRTESASGTIRIGSPKEQADLFAGEKGSVTAGEFSDFDLAALEETVAACTRCPLCEERTRSVFGTGDPKAKIVFIGEAPGREEDLQGKPFVGRAGQLLTKILDSVGFTREEVYIANVLKCRPPENRDPKEEEVRACKPYLKRQIELIRPVLICALGRIAGQNLLETTASLAALRKSIHYYEDVKTVVTYHPAALLRNPNLKRPAWEDIQEVRKIYDEALEGI